MLTNDNQNSERVSPMFLSTLSMLRGGRPILDYGFSSLGSWSTMLGARSNGLGAGSVLGPVLLILLMLSLRS